jgi:CheY-like chemotaxis protein
LRALSPRPIEPKPAAVQSSRQTHIVPPARKADVLAVASVKGPDAEPEPAPSALIRAVASAPILILESDLSIRKLLRRLLERRGYFAAEISHADQLAGALVHHRYALLVVDVSETGTMSVELIAALAHAHPSLKILALSGESHAGAGRAGEFQSRLLALPKPFPLDSFVHCVDRLLGRAGKTSANGAG